MSSLDNFSNDLLELICGHIECFCCILPLTEISPRFNNIVSESPTFMNKLVVKWNFKKRRLSLPAKHRKYSKLQVYYTTGCNPNLKKFFDTFGDNLIDIRLENSNFKMSEVHSFLSVAASTLESIAFTNTSMQQLEELAKIEMPKLRHLCASKIFSIHYREDLGARFDTPKKDFDVRDLLSIVSTNSLESFIFDEIITNGKTATPEEATNLLDFIKSQTNLTAISLRPSVADVTIEFWQTEAQFKMKLNTLHLEYLRGSEPLNFSCHWMFLQSQAETLKTLSRKNEFC